MSAHFVSCCICSNFVDTREKEFGGSPHGCEVLDGAWVCSGRCWDQAITRSQLHNHTNGQYIYQTMAECDCTDHACAEMGFCRAAITRSQPSREVRRQMRRLRPTDPVNAVGYISVAIFAGALVAQWWLG